MAAHAKKTSDAPTCEKCGGSVVRIIKAPHPGRLLELLHEREPSLIQAGIDEEGEPFLFVVPAAELSDAQREALAILMINAASGLLGGSLGGVVH